MSISIFTITHVPFTPPKDSIYVPLQVGKATHPDYGYLGDDTGDNISNKNQYYSELTGLYWVWKNNAVADFIGLCHYRRYFLNDTGEIMKESEYMDILSRYDVMVSESLVGQYDYQTIYERSHDICNLNMTGDIIRELYPDYYPVFLEVIADNHCYVGNLFVAPKELFCAYCEWLFTIFFELENRIDVSALDDYHKRVFGFLSEQLLIVWIKYNHFSYYESRFGVIQEKAETIELKNTLQKYFSAKDMQSAYTYLCNTLEKRPDLVLEISDFNQDLRVIEHILNICRIEQEENLPLFSDFSSDLTILVKHFRLLSSILENIRNNTVEENELQYLTDCKVSYKAIVYMLQNLGQHIEDPIKLLNQLAVIYTNAKLPLIALSFLDETLNIQKPDQMTLSNIVAILQNIGQNELASEYMQLLNDHTPKRIVLFTNFRIFSLTYISNQYAFAMETLGHTVFRFDVQNWEESYMNLITFQEKGLDAAVTFNNIGFRMFLQTGYSLWDMWNIPCYNIIFDHPMHYFDTLDKVPENGVVACADKNHMDYIKRFYPSVKRTIFLPTAGECLKPFSSLKPFKERPIDILLIGSFKYNENFAYDEFSLQLATELFRHPSKTFEETLEYCLFSHHRYLSNDDLKECIQKYRSVEVNVCSIFREKIVESLINSGISVMVCGNSWKKSELSHHPNFIWRATCPMEEGIRLMEESKIVLNQLAWFKAGTSERIYEAMFQGAIALTDDSIYLKETFEDSVDIMFYSLEHLDALPDIVHSLLSNPTLTETIRINAYQKALANHTWLQRASTLLDDFS